MQEATSRVKIQMFRDSLYNCHLKIGDKEHPIPFMFVEDFVEVVCSRFAMVPDLLFEKGYMLASHLQGTLLECFIIVDSLYGEYVNKNGKPVYMILSGDNCCDEHENVIICIGVSHYMLSSQWAKDLAKEALPSLIPNGFDREFMEPLANQIIKFDEFIKQMRTRQDVINKRQQPVVAVP